jgi:SAM-dependent methyltransferase
MWHLDTPQLDTGPADGGFAGWIAGTSATRDLQLSPNFAHLAPRLSLRTIERPDVAPALGMPGLEVLGFEGALADTTKADGDYMTLEFTQGEQRAEIIIPLGSWQPHSLENKAAKLERVRKLLQCPDCGAELLQDGKESLSCSACEGHFHCDECIDFLSQQTRNDYRLAHTDRVSENPYDGEILNIINRHRNGWVLDCGAGRRERYYENVVNFEIVDYPSTDVMGLGERLPFRDAAFDAVLSCAVLEHVRDPFRCASEILRVLKPGGTLYCQAPFLQPFHGYPDHYYNMTSQGLINLFGDAIQVEHLGPLNFGQPVAALQWILGAYAAGLSGDAREAFLDMPVRELVNVSNAALLSDYVSLLSHEARDQLACCNLLIGSKQ